MEYDFKRHLALRTALAATTGTLKGLRSFLGPVFDDLLDDAIREGERELAMPVFEDASMERQYRGAVDVLQPPAAVKGAPVP
jgi:hypothetical protein